ncbi:MAG: RNA-guided pseudouridylation complex pseudouridine synthase subunit Cbf5 [Thaumarchaeota archaeon]|nr:RNA-guided pseudouridylation complex pseudouridine synthase subunit Cbf5 [Nitrososphaerota archaeon]MCL5066764.1 RNA-guided pseudouridylation complex pseudouridine synthase subunit Cbf5 [Nitrososphaerota archaeon]
MSLSTEGLDLSHFTSENVAKNDSELIVLREDESSKKYGYYPAERPIKEYLDYGFVLLDKPQGPTSHEVVAWVRKMFGQERAGHSGTLDPMVTGILPIGLGDATKALSTLLLGPKEYICVARLHDSIPDAVLQNALNQFKGPIYQRPPQRSAVKRTTRTRKIHELEVIEKSGNLLLLRILCESGTYIRKLVYDIGEVVVVGATMAELRRSRVCHLTERDLVRLHDLNEANEIFKQNGDDSALRKLVRPVESALGFLKQIRIRDSAVESICQGAQLAIPGVVAFSKGISKGEIVRILSGKGELVAIAEAQLGEADISSGQHGIAAITRRVVMRAKTYPKMWTSKKEEVGTEEISEKLLKSSILDSLEQEEEH